MPGVVEMTNIENIATDKKTEDKTKKMKKKTKVSATCASENQDQVKVAVEIGKSFLKNEIRNTVNQL